MKKRSILILILLIIYEVLSSQSLKRSGEYYYVMNYNNKDTIYTIIVNNGVIIDTSRVYTKIKSNRYFYYKDTTCYESGRFIIKLSKNNQFEIPNHFVMDKIGIWKERYPDHEYINYFGLIINYSTLKKTKI